MHKDHLEKPPRHDAALHEPYFHTLSFLAIRIQTDAHFVIPSTTEQYETTSTSQLNPVAPVVKEVVPDALEAVYSEFERLVEVAHSPTTGEHPRSHLHEEVSSEVIGAADVHESRETRAERALSTLQDAMLLPDLLSKLKARDDTIQRMKGRRREDAEKRIQATLRLESQIRSQFGIMTRQSQDITEQNRIVASQDDEIATLKATIALMREQAKETEKRFADCPADYTESQERFSSPSDSPPQIQDDETSIFYETKRVSTPRARARFPPEAQPTSAREHSSSPADSGSPTRSRSRLLRSAPPLRMPSFNLNVKRRFLSPTFQYLHMQASVLTSSSIMSLVKNNVSDMRTRSAKVISFRNPSHPSERFDAPWEGSSENSVSFPSSTASLPSISLGSELSWVQNVGDAFHSNAAWDGHERVSDPYLAHSTASTTIDSNSTSSFEFGDDAQHVATPPVTIPSSTAAADVTPPLPSRDYAAARPHLPASLSAPLRGPGVAKATVFAPVPSRGLGLPSSPPRPSPPSIPRPPPPSIPAAALSAVEEERAPALTGPTPGKWLSGIPRMGRSRRVAFANFADAFTPSGYKEKERTKGAGKERERGAGPVDAEVGSSRVLSISGSRLPRRAPLKRPVPAAFVEECDE
ncbi:uncharacterized protein BXZ73DRAFT_99890 [Epithele typhae]|uniref:uncharacterized protein n=1 Tax=Epithele typhae TaxID=378194 RepID=UPI00200813BB|nr:uncharacterized protein BXZ73DRAFT_99890 [Epithele typhae]KAH9938829.1 hypothetical protein BXZ73DRAFT_99890 [Epithele typhae]